MSNFKKEWSCSEVRRFISVYETKRCLWDDNCQDYKNRYAKDEALTECAIMFNTNVDEIRRKIHNLRNQFCCELKKSTKKPPQGTNDISFSRWPYFKSLLFLLQRFGDRHVAETSFKEEVSQGMEGQNENSHTGSVIVEEHSGRIALNASELKLNGKRKMKHLGCTSNQILLKKAIHKLAKQRDECDIFGNYIASEMRSLKNENLKRKMKLEIQRIVLEICEKDDELTTSELSKEYRTSSYFNECQTGK